MGCDRVDDNCSLSKLYCAIQMNDTVTAIGLISKTKHVNAQSTERNKVGWTMLHWAAFHGNEEVRRF